MQTVADKHEAMLRRTRAKNRAVLTTAAEPAALSSPGGG